MCDGGDVLVCVGELRNGAGARGEEGPRDCAVRGEEEDDGYVGYGFGAGGRRVAVNDALGRMGVSG